MVQPDKHPEMKPTMDPSTEAEADDSSHAMPSIVLGFQPPSRNAPIDTCVRLAVPRMSPNAIMPTVQYIAAVLLAQLDAGWVLSLVEAFSTIAMFSFTANFSSDRTESRKNSSTHGTAACN